MTLERTARRASQNKALSLRKDIPNRTDDQPGRLLVHYQWPLVPIVTHPAIASPFFTSQRHSARRLVTTVPFDKDRVTFYTVLQTRRRTTSSCHVASRTEQEFQQNL